MEDTARSAGGQLGSYAYQDRSTERSTADLVRDIIANVQEMLRSEVKLAKAELREETNKTISGVKKMAIAGMAGLFALTFILWSAQMYLATMMAAWVAALIVGGTLGLTAAVLYSKAKGEFQLPKPEKTIENLKENVEWMKNQTKS
jgi:hypothetical protein